MQSPKLKLYGSGRSRWIRPLWMLRELCVPFELVEVDRAAGELQSETYLALNPTGKIPVLLDDGQPICESAAIVIYLGDKFSERRLIPVAGSIERAIHDQWMFSTLTELESPGWLLHRQINRGEGDESVSTLAKKNFCVAAMHFEARLKEHKYLLGEVFQAVDIVLSHLLTWMVVQPLLAGYPALSAYVKRTTARPAFPREYYGA